MLPPLCQTSVIHKFIPKCILIYNKDGDHSTESRKKYRGQLGMEFPDAPSDVEYYFKMVAFVYAEEHLC